MTGTLTIETMEANGAPVNQAAIRVYERTDSASKFIMGCYTDEKGLSEPITLPTPDSTHSLHSIPQICPYAQYDVQVIKDDFDKETTVYRYFLTQIPLWPLLCNAVMAGHQRQTQSI